MKKLFILATAFISLNSFSASVVPGLIMSESASGEAASLEAGLYGITTSSAGALAAGIISTVGSPVVGLVVLGDNGVVSLDLENENTIDELQLIQFAIEDGEELSQMQAAMLEIGMANGQVDENANIL